MRFYTYAYVGKDGSPFFVGASTGDGWKFGFNMRWSDGMKLYKAVADQRRQGFEPLCQFISFFESVDEAMEASDHLADQYRLEGFKVLTRRIKLPRMLDDAARIIRCEAEAARREREATRCEEARKQKLKSAKEDRIVEAKNQVAKAQAALDRASSYLAELENQR